MKTQQLAVGLVSIALLGLALGCERANQPSGPALSRINGSSARLGASEREGDQKLRWDLISVNFATGTVSAGGVASADANDGSKITLTGSGTFQPGDKDDVTGGGTWQTFDPAAKSTGTGTYRVSRLVRFDVAPGTFPLQHDNIGLLANARAGLAVLQISYSDGKRGILVVSCDLRGTPDAVFEGVTASKGFVDFWNREKPPAPPGNANRTAFHLLSEDND
jgi:hypothetical protein